MAIFQQSVLKTISQDESLVAKRYKVEFVKSVKEEKYQEVFLKDIF